MEAVELILAPAPTEDLRRLINELNEELSALYTPEQRHGLDLAMLFQPHIRFFIAYCDCQAVGCGGVAFFQNFAELKRMYVRKPWRGKGIADALIARLAQEAVNCGRGLLRLETGSHSLAAIRFYDRLGFRHCSAFEPYAQMPPSAIITSVFMEKPVP